MPKVKTHRGAAKRFRLTRNGKGIAAHSSRSHKLTRKGAASRQDLRQSAVLSPSDTKRLKRLLPGA